MFYASDAGRARGVFARPMSLGLVPGNPYSPDNETLGILKQLRADLVERAEKTIFGDPKNGGFKSPPEKDESFEKLVIDLESDPATADAASIAGRLRRRLAAE